MSKNKLIAQKLFQILYPRVVLLDYLRFGIAKAWLPKIVNRNKIIIFDRFVYDVVLAMSKEFDFPDSRRERLLKLFSKLLPNPDVIFIIDVPPEVSYLRKKEEIESIENATALWENYQGLYSLLNNLAFGEVVRVDNTREIETVEAEILKITLNLIEGE